MRFQQATQRGQPHVKIRRGVPLHVTNPRPYRLMFVEQLTDQVGCAGQMRDHRREEMCLLDLEVRPQRLREEGDHPVHLCPPVGRPVRPRRW